MSDTLLFLRIAFATAVVLAPGWLVARALGVRAAAAALAWALALVFAAAAVTFAVGTSLTLALVLLIGVGAGALPFAFKTRPLGYEPRFGPVRAVVGVRRRWSCSGSRSGTSPVRSAATVSSISPERGSWPSSTRSRSTRSRSFPTEGYIRATPSRSGTSSWRSSPPSRASIRPTSSCTRRRCSRRSPSSSRTRPAGRCSGAGRRPRARRRLRSRSWRWRRGTAARSQPSRSPPRIRARCSRPRRSRWRSPACGRRPARSSRRPPPPRSRSRSCTRPTRSFSGCRSGGSCSSAGRGPRRDARSGGIALGALVLPAGVFFAWLLPIARDTASVRPDAEERARALEQYAGQLVVESPERFHLAPEVLGRAGAVAVAALLLVPLAGLAARRRWAAYVVGGSLAVLGLVLVSAVFTPSRTPSRSPRHAELRGSSFAFAFGGGLEVVTALLGPLAAPLALAAGIVLQLVYPGDFDYRLTEGGRRSRRGSPSAEGWRRSRTASSSGRRVRLPAGLRRERSCSRSRCTLPGTGRPPTPVRRARSPTAWCASSAGCPPGRRCTRIPRRATGSPRRRRSTSVSHLRAMSPTPRTTDRESASTSFGASPRAATSGSRAPAARGGSSSTVHGSTPRPTSPWCTATRAGRSIGCRERP